MRSVSADTARVKQRARQTATSVGGSAVRLTDVTTEGVPGRPRWWGRDWKGAPIALWLTLIVNGSLGFVVGYFLLRDIAPGLFAASHATSKGITRGTQLAALLGGASTFPALLAWSRALRRRGEWPPRT
jgi:hypothetical protein